MALLWLFVPHVVPGRSVKYPNPYDVAGALRVYFAHVDHLLPERLAAGAGDAGDVDWVAHATSAVPRIRDPKIEQEMVA